MSGIAVDDDVIMHQGRPVHHGVKLVVGAGDQVQDIARGLRARRRGLPDLRRHQLALGAIVWRSLRVDGPGGDVEAEDGTLEDTVSGFGLVGGHFVARLVDAREAVVAVLPDLAADVAAIDDDVGVSCSAEGGALAVVDREGGLFAADP